MSISENIHKVRKILSDFPGSKLLVVTKRRSPEEIREVICAGVDLIGENRVQEMEVKSALFPSGIQKHLIGHLQSNKVRLALQYFDLIESIDSLNLAERINSLAIEGNRVVPVFLQVNISQEPQKSGFTPGEFLYMYQKIAQLNNIKINGLMCLGKLNTTAKETRKFFSKMKLLHTKCIQNFNIDAAEFQLSMGMSQDYRIALEEGSTLVRLGQAIFDF